VINAFSLSVSCIPIFTLPLLFPAEKPLSFPHKKPSIPTPLVSCTYDKLLVTLSLIFACISFLSSLTHSCSHTSLFLHKFEATHEKLLQTIVLLISSGRYSKMENSNFATNNLNEPLRSDDKSPVSLNSNGKYFSILIIQCF
jgi:hypothetical protein